MTDDYSKYSNYYFQKYLKTNVIFFANHDYIMEKNLWKSFHEKKIMKLFQKTKPQEKTEKPPPPWHPENESNHLPSWSAILKTVNSAAEWAL